MAAEDLDVAAPGPVRAQAGGDTPREVRLQAPGIPVAAIHAGFHAIAPLRGARAIEDQAVDRLAEDMVRQRQVRFAEPQQPLVFLGPPGQPPLNQQALRPFAFDFGLRRRADAPAGDVLRRAGGLPEPLPPAEGAQRDAAVARDHRSESLSSFGNPCWANEEVQARMKRMDEANGGGVAPAANRDPLYDEHLAGMLRVAANRPQAARTAPTGGAGRRLWAGRG